jgi:hypothetical protein
MAATAEQELLAAERRAARGLRGPAAALPAAVCPAHPGCPRLLRGDQRPAGHLDRQHRPDPPPLPGQAASPPGNRRLDQRRSRHRARHHMQGKALRRREPPRFAAGRLATVRVESGECPTRPRQPVTGTHLPSPHHVQGIDHVGHATDLPVISRAAGRIKLLQTASAKVDELADSSTLSRG